MTVTLLAESPLLSQVRSGYYVEHPEIKDFMSSDPWCCGSVEAYWPEIEGKPFRFVAYNKNLRSKPSYRVRKFDPHELDMLVLPVGDGSPRCPWGEQNMTAFLKFILWLQRVATQHNRDKLYIRVRVEEEVKEDG